MHKIICSFFSRKDPLMMPSMVRCMACKINYDAIVKLETIDEDMEYIRRKLKIGQQTRLMDDSLFEKLKPLGTTLVPSMGLGPKLKTQTWYDIDFESLTYDFWEFDPNYQPYYKRLQRP
jgi:hypothetical protein